ncbi:virginiamycin B lyase family protein [Nocardioides sp.]|uniref:Vgb family protein n=1 Tax=Nocardioides sp. TaxID=35761 RepID=UPI002ED52E60
MALRTSRAIAVALAAGLVLTAGAAVAAPVGKLQQFRVLTDNSEPRSITAGSDGNVWFTQGTSFTDAPAVVARITPGGEITEFTPTVADGCNFCILTDIAQGPDGILYLTSNDPSLIRFDVDTGTFEPPVQMPNNNALGGNLAVGGDDVWVTDFNNDTVWRYDIPTGQFTSFPVADPADVAVDPAGNAWFADAFGSAIGRIDAVTGEVTSTPTPLAPRSVAVAADGQVWFTARFTPQGVGRLDPVDNSVEVFPLAGVGPQEIAASPDGTVWFTQTTKGNIARADNTGVIFEGKVVKGSGAFGITVDGDGDPWYTMPNVDKVATFQLR